MKMKKTYKINYKILEELETKLNLSGNVVTLNTISLSLNKVISYYNEPLYLAPSNIEMCIKSLKEYDIIEEISEDAAETPRQLNS